MKKLKVLFFAFNMLCISIFAFGQIESGIVLLGGSSKLSLTFNTIHHTQSYNDESNFRIEFAPQIGIFVWDNITVGIEIPLNYNSMDGTKTTSVAFTPFLRTYLGRNKVKPYIHSGIGLGYLFYENSSNYYSDNSLSFFICSLGGGIDIPINDCISFDLGLVYGYLDYKQRENIYSDDIDKITNLSFQIGLVFYLNKKKETVIF